MALMKKCPFAKSESAAIRNSVKSRMYQKLTKFVAGIITILYFIIF